MNRKQRRASQSRGSEPERGATTTTSPGAMTDLLGAAMAFHRAGAFAEAERQYRHVLTSFPGQAEAHLNLGAVLMAQGRTGEAIMHFERARDLDTKLPGANEALGRAYLTAGNLESAIDAATRTLVLKETPHSKAFFAQCIRLARFTKDNVPFRRLLVRALSEGWARPRELTGVCLSLIKLNGVVIDCVARASAAWPTRLPATELCGASGMAALAEDKLLCALLECDPISDVGLERLLTNVRYARLALGAADGTTEEATDKRLLGFYCAIARQSFINDYVFSMTGAEADRAQHLRTSLETTLAAGSACSCLLPVVVAAYFPLHTLANAQALIDRPWPEPVKALLVQQVKEPAEERQIAATIPVLTQIDGEVSRAVRQQYEESPYPRWSKALLLGPSVMRDAGQPERAFDVLIAGCGTGLSAIEFARHGGSARVLAIDLSLASLSYAKRMAQSYDLTNIEFGQADIMRLAAIDRQFDFIDASGVLHHLADPWAGWRVLLSMLRPGGTMQVGLYSELARPNVVAARALIAERGYRPTAEDIRRCREDIIAASDPLLRSVAQWEDFYTTNECRDLLFHVQEHRITLRKIKAFLAANDLQFAGFHLDGAALHRFAARFPERAHLTDLDCWDAFETEAPATFASMYQFRVHKAAPSSNGTAAKRHFSV
jgi:2-polyprenyl-3-methyl-5-hydroxy-6-metoxy-1,4-benzoquinol methylase